MTNQVSDETWQKLYRLADQIKTLAPWQWMEETDLFGVQAPHTGTLSFISVMGNLGEHLAVSVYLGSEGLDGFERLQQIAEDDPYTSIQVLIETPQLQLSFEDRDTLRAADIAVIKRLGRKYRGSQAWPLFRSYRPGMVPWFIEPEEAQRLCVALEQLLEVAPRLQADPTVLFDAAVIEKEDAPRRYLIRRPRPLDGAASAEAGGLVIDAFTWEDVYQDAPQPQAHTLELTYNQADIAKIAAAKSTVNAVQIDFFMRHEALQDKKDERPFFGYILLMVEERSGMILCAELLSPAPSLQAMWSKIPGVVAASLAHHDIKPKQITVRSEWLRTLLEPMTTGLAIRLRQSYKMKALDRALQEMAAFGG